LFGTEVLLVNIQRGFINKRDPRSFQPSPSIGSKRYIIAPKARQMSKKWKSFMLMKASSLSRATARDNNKCTGHSWK